MTSKVFYCTRLFVCVTLFRVSTSSIFLNSIICYSYWSHYYSAQSTYHLLDFGSLPFYKIDCNTPSTVSTTYIIPQNWYFIWIKHLDFFELYDHGNSFNHRNAIPKFFTRIVPLTNLLTLYTIILIRVVFHSIVLVNSTRIAFYLWRTYEHFDFRMRSHYRPIGRTCQNLPDKKEYIIPTRSTIKAHILLYTLSYRLSLQIQENFHFVYYN